MELAESTCADETHCAVSMPPEAPPPMVASASPPTSPFSSDPTSLHGESTTALSAEDMESGGTSTLIAVAVVASLIFVCGGYMYRRRRQRQRAKKALAERERILQNTPQGSLTMKRGASAMQGRRGALVRRENGDDRNDDETQWPDISAGRRTPSGSHLRSVPEIGGAVRGAQLIVYNPIITPLTINLTTRSGRMHTHLDGLRDAARHAREEHDDEEEEEGEEEEEEDDDVTAMEETVSTEDHVPWRAQTRPSRLRHAACSQPAQPPKRAPIRPPQGRLACGSILGTSAASRGARREQQRMRESHRI